MKPIFVVHLPIIGINIDEDTQYIVDLHNKLKKLLEGWAVIISPSTHIDRIQFESFTANNLKPVEIEQFKSMLKKIEKEFLLNNIEIANMIRNIYGDDVNVDDILMDDEIVKL